jgi:hypothetical protein
MGGELIDDPGLGEDAVELKLERTLLILGEPDGLGLAEGLGELDGLAEALGLSDWLGDSEALGLSEGDSLGELDELPPQQQLPSVKTVWLQVLTPRVISKSPAR